MIEFDDGEERPAGGAPAWMATFADLMSLLMTFFVLLLSFSEMDVEKYKRIAGSMRFAFGVQNEVNVQDIPKGTSVIAREFSPGKTEPTQIKTVRQHTTDANKQSLRVGSSDQGPRENSELSSQQAKQMLLEKLKGLIQATRADKEKLAKELKNEINSGKIEINASGRSINIRIREQGSFGSGSATLNADFVPVMARVRQVLSEIVGTVSVEGHTDNVPIANERFRSNWDLSASRALSVAHELLKDRLVDSNRFMVVGYADTRPFVSNDNEESRMRNRRVEIVIRQGFDEETSQELKTLRKSDPELLQSLDLGQLPGELESAAGMTSALPGQGQGGEP